MSDGSVASLLEVEFFFVENSAAPQDETLNEADILQALRMPHPVAGTHGGLQVSSAHKPGIVHSLVQCPEEGPQVGKEESVHGCLLVDFCRYIDIN